MRKVSEPQLRLLTRLYYQKGFGGPSFGIEELTMDEAKQEIDRLMKMPTLEFGDDKYFASQEEITAARAEERAERQQ